MPIGGQQKFYGGNSYSPYCNHWQHHYYENWDIQNNAASKIIGQVDLKWLVMRPTAPENFDGDATTDWLDPLGRPKSTYSTRLAGLVTKVPPPASPLPSFTNVCCSAALNGSTARMCTLRCILTVSWYRMAGKLLSTKYWLFVNPPYYYPASIQPRLRNNNCIRFL